MKYIKRSARNALRARCDPQHRTDPDAKLVRYAADACALAAHGADRSDLGRIGIFRGLAAQLGAPVGLQFAAPRVSSVGWRRLVTSPVYLQLRT